MAPEWIPKSKISPPSPPAGWLERDLPLGLAGLPLATALVAGPGHGKTLALLALARRGPADALAAWVTLDAYDSDVASFFHAMLGAMREAIPDFGRELAERLRAGQMDAGQLWKRFFAEVAAYNLPGLVLAIDDLHHVTQPCGGAPLDALLDQLEHLPPATHVLYASRRREDLPPARVRARGKVAVLDAARLAFSPEEAEAFLTARAPTPAVLAAWRERAMPLEGWPLGLHLVTLAPEGRPTPADGDLLADYVAEELYAAQSPGGRTFMLASAILDELAPEVCQAALDQPDAAEHLAALEAGSLLVRVGGASTHRYPAYLRAFLLAEAARTAGSAALAGWHRRAAAYFQTQGRAEAALPHLLAAREWPGAVAACLVAFPRLRFDGRHAQLERWLAGLPREVVAGSAGLTLWVGHLASHAGDTVKAVAAYERALALARAAEDGEAEFAALMRLFTLAIRGEDAGALAKLTFQAMAKAGAGRPADVVDLHLARACAADLRGDQTLMRECNEAALAIAPEGDPEIAASHVIAHLNLFTHALHHGDVARARAHAGHAGDLARAHAFQPYELYVGFLRAHLDLLEGRAAAAAAYLRALGPGWEDMLDWHMRGVAQAVAGAVLGTQGDADDARAWLARSVATFEAGGYPEGRKVPLEHLAWLEVQQREPARAVAVAKAARDAEHPNVYDLALALVEARAEHLAGRPGAALALLDEARPLLAGLEARLLEARAALFAAAARLGLGERAAAERELAGAAALIDRHDLGFLQGQDRELWLELAALREVPAAVLAPRLEAAPPAAALVDPVAPGGAAAPRPGQDLALVCLGGFEVRVGGVHVDQWPRRKAKVLLARLVLGRKPVRQGELQELLGDGDAIAGAAILKVVMPVLRRTLEPALAKGTDSSFVLTKEDAYALAWERVEACDLHALERGLAEADLALQADPAAAAASYQAALALYRGDLFDEPFLATFFELEREALRTRVTRALGWLAAYHAGRGAHRDAEAALVRATEVAPCDASAYLALMGHHHAHRRPERARQVYWDYRRALKQHQGLAPDEAFEASVRALAAGGGSDRTKGFG